AYGYGHSCRMRARNLVAETKPLLIRFKPDARWPRELHGGRIDLVRARVTFGADGKVQQVEPGNNGLSFDSFGDKELITHPGVVAMWNAVERAARQIQFEPELINGVPVSVTKDVEIHFMAD
ncbi:MAG TPA: hypothetical protein VE713_13130, partial [Pyrinomonadaceae bacterium]|nr:hypothetical protein [Pyrinomonadaceae bacterium]